MTEAAGRPRLHGWLAPPILAAAGLSIASGYAQFAATATLGDVAAAFGEVTGGDSIVAQAGLAGTTLGFGMAAIRLASLASLPIAELADRLGRRRVLLWAAAIGLTLTAAAALAPSFWVFVAVLALGRPMLSAVNAVAGVVAAEETASRHRSSAVGLIAAAYGAGAGLSALVRGIGGQALDFRTVFALCLLGALLVPALGRPLAEPDRYVILRGRREAGPRGRTLDLGRIPARLRRRLSLLATLAAGLALASGPVNSLLFVYAERIVGLSPQVTALVVLSAGPTGLAGLVAGRWAADRFGRRPTAMAAQLFVAAGAVTTYAGGPVPAIAGYLLTILAAGAFAPAIGALAAELFPTSARATAAGWLTVASVTGAVTGLITFGITADAVGFARAAWVVALPVALATPLYLRLPETRGMELEESAPEP